MPGRAFTRRMYAKFKVVKDKLKPHHHITLDREFEEDCRMWLEFLDNNEHRSISRPFLDLDKTVNANVLRFYTDATANFSLGFGCIFNESWIFKKWETNFMKLKEPSIEFLELYALCVGIFTWIEKLPNQRIVVFCDNEAVVSMVNNTTSGCKYCMVLIRQLTLKSMNTNLRVFARHVSGKDNDLSDSLSRLKINKFKCLAEEKSWEIDDYPTKPSTELWPLSRFWKSL